MIRINDRKCKSTLKVAAAVTVLLLFVVAAALGQQTIDLTAAPTTTTLPDGTVVPMWGYFCGTSVAAIASGTNVTSYSGNTVTDGSLKLAVNSYIGKTITAGQLSGVVTSNTATSLTVAGWFPIPGIGFTISSGTTVLVTSVAASTSYTLTSASDSSGPMTTVNYAGDTVTVTTTAGTITGIVASNTATTITLTAAGWTGATTPVANTSISVGASTAACSATNPGATASTPAGWVASNPYAVGTHIVDSNGNVQVVTTAGTSGTAAPTWATAGTTTETTGVVWTFVGSLANYLVTASSWSPVVISVPTGQGLIINLSNSLSFTPAGSSSANTIPTSIVIVGQVGGGLGGAPTTTPSPSHADAQGCPTWFIANPGVPGQPCTATVSGASNTPPTQGSRIQSMATEVAAGATTTLTWAALKPGTYLLESGTHPSIQVPMGLIGVLVVTTAPSGTTAGAAYPAVGTSPAVPYNAEVPIEFSEIDPVQNKEVDQAVRTAGFSETAVWTRMTALGSVSALTLTAAGTGYTSAPTVTIGSPTGGSPAQATATATVGALVSSITVTNGGTGYSTTPTVTITDTAPGVGTGATAVATVVNGVITSIAVTNPGSLYSKPIVAIADITGGTGTNTSATATASTVGTTGVIYALNLTNSGEGYTAAPSVTIPPPASGTPATATSAVSSGGCGGGAHTCYPPAVNYTPFYYLINGLAFNKTAPAASVFAASAGVSSTGVPVTTGITGTVLVRVVNAGLRLHVPSIVNSLTRGFNGLGTSATVSGFTVIAEDGNVLPNVAPPGAAATAVPVAPRVQTDVLMVPSKVYDVLVNVPAASTCTTTPCATPALPIYDRALSLSGNSSVRDAGMVAYISVNNATTSAALPVTAGTGVFAAAVANPDTYDALVCPGSPCTQAQPFTVSDPSRGVIANDISVYGVALDATHLPASGTITCGALAQSTPAPGMCANGTFTYTPNAGSTATTDSFGYCANGTTQASAAPLVPVCTTVTLGGSALTGNPTAIAQSYMAKTASYFKMPSPGLLVGNSDPNNLPLSLVVTGTAPAGVTWDAAGGFSVLNPSPSTTANTAFTFSYTVQNSQGRTATGSATVTFPTPSNLMVNVLDAQAYNACQGNSTCISTLISTAAFADYRWIIEEDKTFWVDPNCTTNASITTAGCPSIVGPAGTSTVPSFGVNFHTSNMDFVAQGCTGPLSCEYGQTMLDNRPVCTTPPNGTTPGVPAGCSMTAGQHIPAVCDLGNGACRPDTGNGTTAGGFPWVNPSQVHLDPAKRYYISVLPGDAGNPFPTNVAPPTCNGVEAPAPAASNTGCGHTMSGASIPPACNVLGGTNACTATSAFTAPVNVLVLPTPLPTGRLSVIVFEDDFPLNGEQDGGGGNGTVAPIEPGLGGFNLVLWDTFGGLGDVTGQNTYDMFNMPLSNGLAGTIDPSTGLNACPVSATPLTAVSVNGGPTGAGSASGAAQAPNSGMTGMIVTCPKYESDNATLSPLAGQAVIYNLMPEKFSVQAYPGADRIARGEEWLQTNSLDGQHQLDSFIRIGEPSYFQEYGPAGYHVSIGFANPAIINARAKDVCAGFGTPGTTGPCTNTIKGQVDVQRISRTPDQRLYPSGSRAALSWTQCWVSLGDPDGEDFKFTKCDANGNFQFTNVPGGQWRMTIGDQWNDQIIDGLSTPVNVGTLANGTAAGLTCPGSGSSATVCNMGSIGVQQWQANLYTRVFVDDNKNGIWDPNEIGIPLIYTRIYYRDGHSANGLNTDFNGVANFNETYPLFNWYVVEADSTRYKTTGIHTVYDAGGPADGTSYCGSGTSTTARPCGSTSSTSAYAFMSNTFEAVPLPSDLSVPGAVYCATADCSGEAAGFAGGTAKPSFATASTGRIDPPWVWGEGWAGLTGLSNWIDFGKAPYAACNLALAPTASGNYCAAVTTTAPGSTTSTTSYVGENGGIHGQVTYASTRPFDDASQMILQPWEPLVPGVTINLFQEGFAADGVTPTLTMVDTTVTSSWDAWAQGFYPNSAVSSGGGGGLMPYMNCPGQGTATAGSPNQDLFYYTIFDQPNFLDYYSSIHSGGTVPLHPLPYSSQYKCYDSMHQANQLQPAVYDGEFYLPSSLGINPTNGKPLSAHGCVGNAPGTACPAASTTTVTVSNMPGTNCTVCVANPDSTDVYRVGSPMLPPGKYVVQVIMPPGYEVYKEEDKNLLIGDNFIAPVTQQFGGLGTDIFIIPDQASVASLYDPSAAGYNPNNFQDQTTSLGLGNELSGVPGYPGFQDPLWPCVGEQRVVPDYLSLFPQAHEVAPFAGAIRPLCDRKEVTLPNQASVRMHFAIFTSTHIASKFAGGITDDYTSEFDPFSPQFGEKFAPPNLPVSTKDYLGNEISRVYSDHWGTYDGLTFSSWEVNPPNITGYSPTMQVQCMNDPGPIMDTRSMIACSGSACGTSAQGTLIVNPTFGKLIQDPLYNAAYSNFCYEDPYMPGLTAYLDTPVVPTAAFVGAAYNNPDCSYPDTTPAIKEVDGTGIGPWVSGSGVSLTITALGDQQVNNAAYSGPSASVAPFNQKFITRHYGFGAQCTTPTVNSPTCNHVSEVTIGGMPAIISSWSDLQIVAVVPSGVPNCPIQQQAQYQGAAAQCGQLLITAGNGKQSIDTVTVTIGGKAPHHVLASDSVQAAIDAAMPGDMLMIDPTCFTVGTSTSPSVPATCSSAALGGATPTQTSAPGAHNEMLIMWKPVRLQGVGAVSSVLDASAFPGGKLLDPWRRRINCLFGLALNGTPTTSTTGPGSYDPNGTFTCGGWTGYVGAPNSPQVDRLPLEATVGWDATQNGNLAEQLQEPSLMGAFEGAVITVLGKGVDFHGAFPWTDGNEGGAFPPVTTLLTGVGPNPLALPVGDANALCMPSSTNPFPSNFVCNPSSIDGLTIRDSSQGGGGIFAHGWAHHLQIANNRVYNNAGTLTGGISVGQGEFPTPYIQGGTTNAAPGSCSDGTGLITNQHQPYCLQLQVNVHNNYVTNNSSLGDELFSGTLAGAGGVTFCTGNDYYVFQSNWVCGNLSSGEGGGVVHLGEIQNGDIEHNTIALNQSTNPTIPTNGGGIMVQGTPDTDPTCGQQIDADCPPGLSDGIGHNLVINANLIQGNMAESGSGGGIRLQQVNGTDVSTFPGNNPITAADEGHTVTIHIPTTATLPAVGNSVTIAAVACTPAPCGYNGTFTVTGIGTGLFTYLATVTGLGTGTGGTFTNTSVAGQPAQAITSATETGAGVVTITSTLSPTVGDSVTIIGVSVAGYNGTFIVTGVPAAGTFTYNNPNSSLAAGTGGTVSDSNPNQAVTALWNGVSITNNIIVNNIAGWDGAGISLQDAMNVSIINNTISSNDSLASSGVLTQSVGTPDASAPPGSCVQAGGTTSCPQSAGVTSTLHSTLLTTTFTGLTLICPFGEANTGTGSCMAFSNPQLQNNVIWQNRSFIIGVGNQGQGTQNQQKLISLFTAGGAVAPVQATSGACGTASYWDIGVRGDAGPGTHGSGFTLSPTYSVLDDTGYASSNLTSSPNIASQYCNGSRVPPECSVADGCGGPNGYGVPPGIVDSSTPNPVFSLTPSATVDEGNNWINVSWGPLSLSNDAVNTASGSTGTGNYGSGPAFGNYALVPASPAIDYVPVAQFHPTTDFFGNPRPDASNPNSFDVGAVEFQNRNVTTPSLSSITPSTGARGMVVNVTLAGQSLTGATAVNVSGGGIAVSNFVAVSATSVTATFTISTTATLTARNVTVTVGGATTNAVTFTVVAPAGPTLTSISPASELRGTSANVTLTGTNFVTGSAVNATPTVAGFSITNVVIVNATTITATFTSTATGGGATPLGNVNIEVANAGGASNAMPFAITGPVLTSIASCTAGQVPPACTGPASGMRGTANSTTIVLTGSGLSGVTAVNVSGNGATVTGVTVNSDTSVSATFTFSAGATGGARNVTVTSPAGNSNAVTFTVIVPPGALSSISPTTGARGTVVPVTLSGTGFTGSTGVTVNGGGIAVSGFTVVNDTTITATFTISATAALTARNVTVATAGGPSNPVTFTVVSPGTPTLASINPNSGLRGTPHAVTLTGTGFTASGTTVHVAAPANGLTITGVAVVNGTTITATFGTTGGATLGPRDIYVTTPGGSTGDVTYTVSGPVLTSISPASAYRGTAVAVSIFGSGLTGTTAVAVSGGGVTVSGITVVNDGQVNATFTFTAGASATARNVTVTAPGGTSNAVTFTVLTPPRPTLTSVAPSSATRGTAGTPNAVAVTLTGTNFFGTPTVTVSGGNVTVSGVTVQSPEQVTATFTITNAAALTTRNVTITVAGVASNTQPFTVQGSTLTSISPTSGERGTTVPVILNGTNLSGATGVTMNGTGVTCTITGTAATTVNASCVITAGAGLTARNVTVTTPISTATLTGAFQVTGATLAISAPLPALNPTPANTVTETSTVTVSNTASGASAAPFTLTAAPTITTVSAPAGAAFSIITGGTCIAGAVVSPGSNCTITVQYAPGTSTANATAHVTVTGTGLATASQTGANFTAN